jgi:site-specific DNA-methyltransferase (adenine-specific)
MLTKKKKQILDYIKRYIKKHDYSPSLEEMAEHFKLVVSTVHQHIDELKRDNYLDKLDNQPRTIQIAENKKSRDLIEIPLLGLIAAGQPIETYEDKEIITVPKASIGSGEHYALKVQGDSMIDEGIFDGSVVIVKKQNIAQNGDTIVALINGSEVTLKKFYREGNKIRLQPANPKIKPILVDPENLLIQGKVINIQRNFEFESKEKELKKPEKSKQSETQKRSRATLKKWLNTIQCMDCVEGMQRLPDESIDLIIADPPYGLDKDFGNDSDKIRGEEYLNFTRKWTDVAIKKLKPNGSFYIFLTWQYSPEVFSLLKKKLIMLNEIIWDRKVPSMGGGTIRYSSVHDNVGFFAKGNKHYFDLDSIRIPYDPETKKARTRSIFIGKPWLEKGYNPKDVWPNCRIHKQDPERENHPTQKPLAIIDRMVKASCPKNGIVLDPFMGSGTTVVSCILTNRNFIGFEINPRYHQTSLKRIQRYSNNLFNIKKN